jgi:hypothetical protein
MRNALKFAVILFAAMVLSFPAFARHTYYVSSGIGSDSNTSTQAQSKTTPWAHSPVAGDHFVFRGGDTWGSASFLWTWSWSGSAGNLIYIGVDPTWFTGGAWSRPILDCQSTCAQQINASSVSYVQWDNFEFTGLFSNAAPTFASVYSINLGCNPGWSLTNDYFHGWHVSHDSQNNVSVMFGCNSVASINNGNIDHTVFDGSDVCTFPGPCAMNLVYGAAAVIHDSYFCCASTLLQGADYYRFYQNTLENVTLSPDGADHENMFESNGDNQLLVYNNVIRTNNGIGSVDLQMSPNAGTTSYAFNNVLVDLEGNNMEESYQAAGTSIFFNNTAEGGQDSGTPSGVCGRNLSSTGPVSTINQHCITTQTGSGWWSGTATLTTPTVHSKATAARGTQRYTSRSAYSFQPTVGTGSTIGNGTNETSLCVAITAIDATAGAACQRDTTYGVTYNTTSHSITGPGRSSTNARPTSANWDIGAFQFSAPPPS